MELLLPELDRITVKVVIVDNASNDDTADLLEQWISRLDVTNKVDLLWTCGCDFGLLRQILSYNNVLSASAYQRRDVWNNFQSSLSKYIHPDNYDKA